MRGLERAEAAGADAIAVFTATTDAFTTANIGMTVEASLAAFAPVLTRAGRARLVAARLRLDGVRLPVHRPGGAVAGGGRRAPPARSRCRRGLLRGHDRRRRPGPGRRADRAGGRGRHPARADRLPLPRHARDGAGQRRGRPRRRASAASTRRPAGPAAAPTRRARPAISRRRTSSTSSTPRAGNRASRSRACSPQRASSPTRSVVRSPSKVGQAGGWDPTTGAPTGR